MLFLNSKYNIMALLLMLIIQMQCSTSRLPDGIRCQYGQFNNLPPTSLTFLLRSINFQQNYAVYDGSFKCSFFDANYIYLYLNGTIQSCDKCGDCKDKSLYLLENEQRTFNISRRGTKTEIYPNTNQTIQTICNRNNCIS